MPEQIVCANGHPLSWAEYEQGFCARCGREPKEDDDEEDDGREKESED